MGMNAVAEKPDLYLEYCKQAVETSRRFDEKMGPYSAEIVPGAEATWHAVITAPAHERIAASHLISRGFGIYLPETEDVEVKRGRKVTRTRPLIPGYLFVYVWDIARHARRIRACTGVLDFLLSDGRIMVIPWAIIDQLRVIENYERPIVLPMDEVVRPKQAKKKRWRKSRAEPSLQAVPAEIIGVHAYSPFIEEMRQGLDDENRIAVFKRALGLAGS